jgi:fatty-acyl-CoA synthase
MPLRGMKVIDKTRTSLPLLRANLHVERPDRLSRAMLSAMPYGNGLLAAVAASSGRYPHALAIVTPDEQVTYRELWRGSSAIARGLQIDGVTAQSRVGVLCRNSTMFVQCVVAGALLGADLVFLNTALGPAQMADTIAAEGVDVVLHDDDFEALTPAGKRVPVSRLRAMRNEFPGKRLKPPPRQSNLVILTSGTTGRPKGASRPSAGSATEGVAAVLGTIPLRARDTIVLPAPFFHAWGLATMLIGLGLSATVVTAAEFDAAGTLELIEEHGARVLVVVPTMLHKICALPPEALASADTTSLRVTASSGSAMAGRLATEVLDRFGPVLYNVYGSTEVATATVASPADLRVAPTTAGRPATGVRVAIVDDAGEPVHRGVTGRIFVGNAARFDGYTGGGGKESIGGLLSSGDLGHVDDRGLLFIDGREDDMIVSGGENVYPSEVEEVLNRHEQIDEAVVIGVEDEKFGRALKAFVIRKPGQQVEASELKFYVLQTLAKYKVPRAFEFVDELPRTASGKVKRRVLV